jgi:hemolysin III
MTTLYRWFREPVSGLTHLAGALIAVPGLAWLIARSDGDPAKLASVVVYGLSVIVLFTSSAVMHLTHGSARLIDWLNRFDHSAIYLLTAGTYTPVCVNSLHGPLRLGLLIAVWVLAGLGVAQKLIVGPGRKSSTLSTAFYIGMGWLAVIALPQLIRVLPLPALLLIVVGGLAYSGGALVYLFDDPDVRPVFGLHEAWHLFVLAGAACHFAAIGLYVV